MYSNKRVNFDPAEKEKDELRKIETASCLMNDESLLATREMLRLCNESQDAGAATLRMIHRQGEQLHRTEMALDSMHVGLQGTEANLIQMQRSNRCCCGICFKSCCLCCSRHKEKTPKIWKTTPAQAQVVNNPKPANAQSPLAQGDFLPRITHDAKEDEMEANLREVSNVIGNLKQIGINQGTEISRQDPMLDRINLKAESNQHGLQSAQTRTDKLLKS